MVFLIIFGYILLWSIFGIISAKIIMNKGYENIGRWFLIGFICGIVGIIIAAIQKRKPEKAADYINDPEIAAAEKSTDSGNVCICPNCDTENKEHAWYCKVCSRSKSIAVKNADGSK